MKLKLTLFLSFILTATAFADEPATSYMNDLIQGAGDNTWWVYPQEINGQTITPPKGGYITRFKIDMNGDGVDEVFLTSDVDVSKTGATWSIYRRETSGSYTKLKDDFFISDNSLWVKTVGGIKKYSILTTNTDQESIITFWLDGSGNFQTSALPLTEAQSKAINGGDQTLMDANGLPDDAKIAQYLDLGTPVTISLQKVLVGKLYQNTNATWRAVNNTFTLSQQYLDPADATDIASLVSWTPPASP